MPEHHVVWDWRGSGWYQSFTNRNFSGMTWMFPFDEFPYGSQWARMGEPEYVDDLPMDTGGRNGIFIEEQEEG